MRTKTFGETVLIVSRNDAFRHLLRSVLMRAGYGIRAVATQEEGLLKLDELAPAVVIVDRTQSGFAQLHRALPTRTPILTVSSHSGRCDEHHCIIDIEDGATRATCNASPSLIAALVTAVLRRQRWQQSEPDSFAVGDVWLDFTSYEVKVGTTDTSLTPTQFRILGSLALAPGYFLSRQTLFEQIWGKDFAISPHTLDVTISSLRRTLRSSGAAPDFIVTLKGVGYKLRPSMGLDNVLPIPVPSLQLQIPQSITIPLWYPADRTTFLRSRSAH